MQLSKYTLTDDISSDMQIVISTVSNAAVVLPRAFLEKILLQMDREEISEEEMEWITELRKMHIIVDDSEHDRALIRAAIRNALMHMSRTLVVAVCPTLDCNLACPYCYEWQQRRPGAMTDTVAEATVGFVERALRHFRPQELVLHIYGGEPLLYPDISLDITRRVADMAKAQDGMGFSLHVTTNGVLATSETMAHFAKYSCIPGKKGLSVQVTIDGPPSIHDKRRKTLDGLGTYETIIANCLALEEDWQLSLRVNLDTETKPSVRTLSRELAKLPWKKKPHLYFSPTQKCNTSHDRNCFAVKEWDEELSSAWRDAAEYGWDTCSHMRYGLCSYHSGTVFLIDPVGYLYTCQAFVGNEKMAIGNVYSAPDDFLPTYFKQTHSNLWETCLDTCELLPYCAGGCRSYAYFDGKINEIYCMKDMLRQAALSYYKFKYKDAIDEFCSKVVHV